MRERTMLVSWGQIPRGRESKALEVFQKAHEYLKKKKEEGKINFQVYFNSQSAELAGFMLIRGQPEFLVGGAEELEELYMQAAAVVDGLSSKLLVGGTEEGVTHHVQRWSEVQEKLGYL